jgi:hypothetical protein
MTTQTLALGAGWTDLPVTMTNAGNFSLLNNAAGNYSGGWCHHDYWYPYYVPIHHTHTIVERDRRPIKLTLSEVERLRVVAKKDKELKATLEKFTDYIEVTVDF